MPLILLQIVTETWMAWRVFSAQAAEIKVPNMEQLLYLLVPYSEYKFMYWKSCLIWRSTHVQIEKPLEGRVGGDAIRWGWKLPLPLNFKCLYLWLSLQTFEKDTATEYLHLLFRHFVRTGPLLQSSQIQTPTLSKNLDQQSLKIADTSPLTTVDPILTDGWACKDYI